MDCNLVRRRDTRCGIVERSTATVTNPSNRINWSEWQDNNGNECVTWITARGNSQIDIGNNHAPGFVLRFAAQTFTGPNQASIDAQRDEYLEDFYAGRSVPGVRTFDIPGNPDRCTKVPVGESFMDMLKTYNRVDPYIAKHHRLGALDVDVSNTDGIIPSSLKYEVDYNPWNFHDDGSSFDYTYEATLRFRIRDNYVNDSINQIQNRINNVVDQIENTLEDYIDNSGGQPSLSSGLNNLAQDFQSELRNINGINRSTVDVNVRDRNTATPELVISNFDYDASRRNAVLDAVDRITAKYQRRLNSFLRDNKRIHQLIFDGVPEGRTLFDSLNIANPDNNCRMRVYFEGEQRFSRTSIRPVN